jgi:8-oxo-dGTP diphosphatase
MKIATLVLITQDDRILLGRKQGSPEIGEGTLNGPGGKQELHETLTECLVRETREELDIGLEPTKVEKCAIITFYAAGEPSFEVHIYHTSFFTGEPHETESMIPEWHPINAIPYERMLESDRTWFPQLVAGEKFNANVYYQEKAKGYLGIEFLPFIDTEYISASA